MEVESNCSIQRAATKELGLHTAAAIGALRCGSLSPKLPEYSVLPLELTRLRSLLSGPLSFALLRLLHRESRLLYAGRLHYPDVLSTPLVLDSMPALGSLMRSEQMNYALAPGTVDLPGWVRFRTEPVMRLNLDSAWNQFSDYLAALNSKHRVKARRVQALSQELTYSLLDLQDLRTNRHLLDGLFTDLKQRLPFMLGVINTRFFEEQAEHYGNRLQLRLYRQGPKAVGFISLLQQDGVLYALQACAEPEENKRLHVYQRMLYDALDLAIRQRCTSLHLGRTAAGIKSSIGAEPLPGFYSVYARGSLRRLALRILARWAKPEQQPIRKTFR